MTASPVRLSCDVGIAPSGNPSEDYIQNETPVTTTPLENNTSAASNVLQNAPRPVDSLCGCAGKEDSMSLKIDSNSQRRSKTQTLVSPVFYTDSTVPHQLPLLLSHLQMLRLDTALDIEGYHSDELMSPSLFTASP